MRANSSDQWAGELRKRSGLDVSSSCSMSVTTSSGRWPGAASGAANAALRFGRKTAVDGGELDIEWVLKRNCSITPGRLLAVYVSLCVLSLGIAVFFWVQGARMIMPFAWAELLALGAAMLVYARHAGDRERIALRAGRLTVEYTDGMQVQRVEFQPAWVHVEPEHDDRSLIELSSQGRRVAIGRFVRPELRADLAQELRTALRRWRQAGKRNVE
jgi:uncharacterized membrane protein